MPFDSGTIERIDGIFEKAVAEGRRTLYEHEVYGILDALGLSVPAHVFIRDPKLVDKKLLSRFGKQVVVKIVSASVPHKSKLGGVKRIAAEDPLFVRYVLDAMREEVLSNFDKDDKPFIEGYLIAELIPFTMALGNEIMIGAREDPSFGPVLTLTKGGEDAEFFARYYDPANIVLAPIREDEARAIVGGTKIRHRYAEAGRPDNVGMIAKALFAISELSYACSFIARHPPKHHLVSLDVNPFVFSEDGRFIAVDGFAEFAPSTERVRRPLREKPESLKPFFEPKGIAVCGTSSDPSKYSMARIIVGLLSEMGRTDIECVNPKGGRVTIGGKEFPLRKSLAELAIHCELIVFAAPADRLMEFLPQVPDGSSVILISGIPQNISFEEFSGAIGFHRARGIRFIGPNCMGVFFAPDRLRAGVDTLFIGEERLKVGYTERSNCALLTQSGAMAITSVERTQNAPVFKSIVSFGNKVDVDLPDLVRYFSLEPATEVIAIYLEGLGRGEGREFFDLARRSKKPIITYKAGRTEAGARAAASHTAAISGSYEVFKAAADQAGIVLIEELASFYDAIKTFSMLSRLVPKGKRVAGLVNAGLDATMSADLLGILEQAVLLPETVRRLEKINTHGLVNLATSFLDVTPMTDNIMFGDFLDALLADPNVDCAFVAVVPHVESLKTTDAECRGEDAVATRLIAAAKRHAKPVVVSVNAGNHYLGLVKYLEEGGLPVFSDIRSAITSLDSFVAYHTAG